MFKKLCQLFLAFAKIGAVTFGGGYAMLPALEKEVVDKKRWATREQIMDYFAIGQCTPGVIFVNTATFVGYSVAGIPGGVVATLGVIFPSLVIITVIAAFLQNFAHIGFVVHAFAGIRVAVAAMISVTVVKMWKTGVKDLFGIIVFVLTFGVSILFDLSPVWMIIASALCGLVYSLRKGVGKA